MDGIHHVFKLQIVTPNGDAINFHGGSKVEIDFITACVEEIMAQDISRFESKDTWKDKIRVGIEAAIMDLKMATVGQSKRANG